MRPSRCGASGFSPTVGFVGSPIAGSSAYGTAIREYRDNQVAKYRVVDGRPVADMAAWFLAERDALEALHGVRPVIGPAIVAFLAEYERDPHCIEDLGAINRWQQRSADRNLPSTLADQLRRDRGARPDARRGEQHLGPWLKICRTCWSASVQEHREPSAAVAHRIVWKTAALCATLRQR